MLGFPSLGYGDPDYYPTLLLSTLLGGGMSSRLFQEVREKRGLVYSIYSFSAPYMDGGLFGIYAGTGESEAEELMPVTLEELRKVQIAVTEAELARARAQVKAALLMSLESTGSRTRATCPAVSGVRPGDPDGGDGGQDQRGDHRGRAARRRAAVPRQADAGGSRPRRAGAEAGGRSRRSWRRKARSWRHRARSCHCKRSQAISRRGAHHRETVLRCACSHTPGWIATAGVRSTSVVQPTLG